MSNQDGSLPLSERELQVLQMVATGASNQQIARQLVISVNTVKVHLRNIFEKLEVQSRTEASLRAIQEGWVTVDDNGAAPPESTIPLKSFLRFEKQRPTLTNWQHYYLMVAILIAVATATTPLVFGRDQGPYFPTIIRSNQSEGLLYGSSEQTTAVVPPGNNTNRWTARDSMPTRRAGLGLVAFDGKIFAAGGVKTNDKATRFLEIYDPLDDSWSDGAAKPTATTNISSVLLNNKIYVPGGCTNDGQAVVKLEIYSPTSDRWEQGQALPEARCGYGLVALKNKLYLLGGWNGNSYQDTVFVFSPVENKWEIADSRMPAAIGYFGAAVLDDKLIYIAGGYDGKSEYNQTYAFDPETGTWSEKAPMQEKRAGLGMVNIAGQLYAVGGGWNHDLEMSERYNPAADSWTAFETPFPNQWRNLGLAALDAEIYAVGGWNGTDEEYLDEIVSYHVSFHLFLPFTGSRTQK